MSGWINCDHRGDDVTGMASGPARKLVLVDDGLVFGGGQVHLQQYMAQPSQFNRTVIMLAPSPLGQYGQHAPSEPLVLQGRRSRAGLLKAWLVLLWLFRRRVSDTVVLANSFMAAMVLSVVPKRGRTYVYLLHEDLSAQWISGIKRWVATRLALPRFDGFVANSVWTASTLPSHLAGRPMRIAFPICNVHESSDPRGTQGMPPAPTRLKVLSLSRITPWKGIDLVIRAVEQLAAEIGDGVELTVAGSATPADAEYLESVLAQISCGSANVTYIGHVDGVAGVLARHDVLVVGSRHPEPFGQVIVQGLAAGLSVVATEAGGPVELLAAEPLGKLVPSDDVAAMAGALKTIWLAQPSASERQASATRARKNYSDGRLSAELDAAVADIVAGG